MVLNMNCKAMQSIEVLMGITILLVTPEYKPNSPSPLNESKPTKIKMSNLNPRSSSLCVHKGCVLEIFLERKTFSLKTYNRFDFIILIA